VARGRKTSIDGNTFGEANASNTHIQLDATALETHLGWNIHWGSGTNETVNASATYSRFGVFDWSNHKTEIKADRFVGGKFLIFGDGDTTPDISQGNNWETGPSTVTITDFDGSDMEEGQMLVVVSKGPITWDVTSSGIKGGTTDIVTEAGDVTTFIYDGTDWVIMARMDMSDNLN
jgi:hypothetical protein